jgi:PKD repeat protein
VTLTIFDAQNKAAAVTQELIVTQPPTADFTVSPQQGNQPLTVQLDASQSSDPDGKIVSWQWQVETGKTATGQPATMTFTEIGPQTIHLTVTDNHGATATAQQTVIVTDLPIARFQTIPNQGIVPMTVTLDGSQSFDPDGGELTHYEWQATSGDISLSATGKIATVTLVEPAHYSLTLTVIDDEGDSDSTSQMIIGAKDALLTFENLQEIYTVGEQITTHLLETLPRQSEELVDLWVAIQTPNQELLFLTTQPQAPYSLEPQPFKTAVSPTDTSHQLLTEIPITPAMIGEYIFYALYVANGKNPLTEGVEIFRSELAIKNITLVQ